MNMNRTARMLSALGLAAFAAAAHGASTEAYENATVQPGGPRTGPNGLAFFNVEGSINGTFASYGVARFDVSAIRAGFDAQFGAGAWLIDSVSLELTQSNAGFTTNGAVDIYFSGDDAVSLLAGVSPLRYGNFATDFAGAPRITGYQFTQVANGQVDSYALYQRGGVNGAGAVALAADIAGDGVVTLALRDVDAGVAATYAGYTNGSFAGPTLVISAAPVPEPATWATMIAGLGILGASAVRRRS